VIDVDGLEYAHARLWARNGERPDEADWRHLEVVRELRAALDAARETRLRDWTAGIAPHDGAHEIEATLRRHWRRLIAEVTGWMPAEWRAPVAWCGALADLPVLQYLARGGPPLAWMRDDPVYRNLCTSEPAACPAALVTGPFAPLVPAWANPDRFLAEWRGEWIRRLPRERLAAAPLLERLATALEQHLALFSDAAPSEGWPLRRALQWRLASLFRRAVLDPAAAFVFLALSALDVERLRGELVRRAAFPRSPLAA
jgi:hypothetical protein